MHGYRYRPGGTATTSPSAELARSRSRNLTKEYAARSGNRFGSIERTSLGRRPSEETLAFSPIGAGVDVEAVRRDGIVPIDIHCSRSLLRSKAHADRTKGCCY